MKYMHLVFILSMLAAGKLTGQDCTVTKPCTFATNIAWDTAGTPAVQAGVNGKVWGTQDVINSQIPFTQVPNGYHVRILSASGDQIAAPHGVPTPNTLAYILVGLTTTTPYQAPQIGAGLGSAGCMLYHQLAITAAGGRIPINEAIISGGDLNADNILILKQAIYLDEFGPQAPVHLETTLVLSFAYIAN